MVMGGWRRLGEKGGARARGGGQGACDGRCVWVGFGFCLDRRGVVELCLCVALGVHVFVLFFFGFSRMKAVSADVTQTTHTTYTHGNPNGHAQAVAAARRQQPRGSPS